MFQRRVAHPPYNIPMSLIALHGVDFSVGGPLLLEHVDLAIEAGERIALIGRNGAGKSTLMRLLAGELKPDDGEVRLEGGRRIARLEQEVPLGAAGSVFDVVAEGLGEVGQLLADYHHLIHAEEIDVDALAEGVSGLLADDDQELAAHLVSVATDDGLRQRLQEGALAHASRFTWTNTATQILEVLAEEALGQRNSG